MNHRLKGLPLSLLMLFCLSCGADETEKTTETTKQDPRVAEILAMDSDTAYGEYLGSECSTCHNETSSDKGIPTIHGREASHLINALLEYRDKQRSNETMQSIAGALSDEEIAALAAYFSSE